MRLLKLAAALLLAFVFLRAEGQTNFATLHTDGAWTWFNDPRALFHNGKLYVGYVRAASGKTVLTAFDLTKGVGSNVWVSGFSQADDHNNPGLLATQYGNLFAPQ
jgi:hypothetical protein